jgi:hypothetical protein
MDGLLSAAAVLTAVAVALVACLGTRSRPGSPTGGADSPGGRCGFCRGIPALLAPTGLFLHLVSIRQSLARLSTNRQKDRRGFLITDSLTSIGATTKC